MTTAIKMNRHISESPPPTDGPPESRSLSAGMILTVSHGIRRGLWRGTEKCLRGNLVLETRCHRYVSSLERGWRANLYPTEPPTRCGGISVGTDAVAGGAAGWDGNHDCEG